LASDERVLGDHCPTYVFAPQVPRVAFDGKLDCFPDKPGGAAATGGEGNCVEYVRNCQGRCPSVRRLICHMFFPESSCEWFFRKNCCQIQLFMSFTQNLLHPFIYINLIYVTYIIYINFIYMRSTFASLLTNLYNVFYTGVLTQELFYRCWYYTGDYRSLYRGVLTQKLFHGSSYTRILTQELFYRSCYTGVLTQELTSR
jgi:hypothetical protein